jgi:hypothetical protein
VGEQRIEMDAQTIASHRRVIEDALE